YDPNTGSLYMLTRRFGFSGNRALAVRRIDAAGVLTTLAGGPSASLRADNILATNYKILSDTFALACGPDGSVYVGEQNIFGANGSHLAIKRITPDGIITTAAGQLPHSIDTNAPDNFATGDINLAGIIGRIQEHGLNGVAISPAGA